jgi:hypothetical protein
LSDRDATASGRIVWRLRFPSNGGNYYCNWLSFPHLFEIGRVDILPERPVGFDVHHLRTSMRHTPTTAITDTAVPCAATGSWLALDGWNTSSVRPAPIDLEVDLVKGLVRAGRQIMSEGRVISDNPLARHKAGYDLSSFDKPACRIPSRHRSRRPAVPRSARWATRPHQGRNFGRLARLRQVAPDSEDG